MPDDSPAYSIDTKCSDCEKLIPSFLECCPYCGRTQEPAETATGATIDNLDERIKHVKGMLSNEENNEKEWNKKFYTSMKHEKTRTAVNFLVSILWLAGAIAVAWQLMKLDMSTYAGTCVILLFLFVSFFIYFNQTRLTLLRVNNMLTETILLRLDVQILNDQVFEMRHAIKKAGIVPDDFWPENVLPDEDMNPLE